MIEKIDSVNRKGSLFNRRFIRDYQTRSNWTVKNSGALTLAFYNTGQHVFMDPRLRGPLTFYDYEWILVNFEDYKVNRLIPLNVVPPQRVPLKLSMHNPMYFYYGIECGSSLSPDIGTEMKCHLLPPMFTLYLAVRSGRVVDSLLLHRPLPSRLFTGLRLLSVGQLV